jgi:hypothetical protein
VHVAEACPGLHCHAQLFCPSVVEALTKNEFCGLTVQAVQTALDVAVHEE